MNLDLSNKNALVGGSSKGIGRAVAIELASMGANITLMARSEKSLKEVRDSLDVSQGQEHDYLIVDFSDSAALQKKVETLVQIKNIHILINNTGGPKGGAIVNAQPEEFVQAFHNHIICNHILVQTVLEGMKKDAYGRIINITSTSIREPIPNLGVSNTIRNAVANWAKTLANELGTFQITVNNVLPGYTSTGRLDEIIAAKAKKAKISTDVTTKQMQKNVPMGRFAQPSEIATVVGFIASPAASYVNGINIPVDGGRTKSL